MLPVGVIESCHRFAARLIAPGGQVYPMGEAEVLIDPAAPAASPYLFGAEAAQPTPAELEALACKVGLDCEGQVKVCRHLFFRMALVYEPPLQIALNASDDE